MTIDTTQTLNFRMKKIAVIFLLSISYKNVNLQTAYKGLVLRVHLNVDDIGLKDYNSKFGSSEVKLTQRYLHFTRKVNKRLSLLAFFEKVMQMTGTECLCKA